MLSARRTVVLMYALCEKTDLNDFWFEVFPVDAY
jgi:hypothetical protein